jgi:DNA-binding transcriptional LysR family regulator
MICREENSSTREFIKKTFEEYGFSCDVLKIISEVHNSTALKYTVMNANEQVISIISKMVIKDEIRDKKLFISKIKGLDLKRKTYIVYKNLTKDIEAIINFVRT